MIATIPLLIVSAFVSASPPAASQASVLVSSQPRSASVFWDGRFVGVSPLTLKAVPYGRHGLRLERHGYRRWVALVAVDKSSVKIEAKLVPQAFGTVLIESDPLEADVFVDGRFEGRAPVKLEHLPVGAIAVRVEKDEFLPLKQEVVVRAGRMVSFKAKLQSKTEAFLLNKIKREPWRVAHYTELGHYYMTQRDYDRAFQAYAKGIAACTGPKAIPNDCLRLYNEMRYCYQGSVVNFADEMDKAELHRRFEQLYADGIKRDPSNERNYWALAKIFRRKGEWEKAISLYEQALKHSRNKRIFRRNQREMAELLYRYGAWLSRHKKYDDAVKQYETAIARFPKCYYTRSAFSSAISLYQNRLKKPDKALALRRKYIELFPNTSTARSYLMEIGRILVSQGKARQGIEEYRRYLKLYPRDEQCPAVLMSIARAQWRVLKDPDAAAATFLQCAETYPKWDQAPQALNEAAQIYKAKRQPILADALRALIVLRYPRSSEAGRFDSDPVRKQRRKEAVQLYSRAGKLERSNLEQALADYRKVVDQYRDSYYAPYAQLRIAALHQTRTKNYEAEIAARERYVDLFPDRDDAPSQLMTLASRCVAIGDAISKTAGSDSKLKAKARSYYDKAVAAYQRVMKQFPKSAQAPVACYQIGWVYHMKTFEQQKAIRQFRLFLRRWPHHENAAAADYYICWIHFLCLKNQRRRAAQLYHQFLLKHPYSSYARSIDYWLDALIDSRPEPKGWWK